MNEFTAPVNDFIESDINSLPGRKTIFFRKSLAELKTVKSKGQANPKKICENRWA